MFWTKLYRDYLPAANTKLYDNTSNTDKEIVVGMMTNKNTTTAKIVNLYITDAGGTFQEPLCPINFNMLAKEHDDEVGIGGKGGALVKAGEAIYGSDGDGTAVFLTLWGREVS